MKMTSRTTMAGLATLACGVVLIAIKWNRGEVLDVTEWTIIGGIIATGIGLLKAADAPKPNPSAKFLKPKLLIPLAVAVLLFGCGKQLTTYDVTRDVQASNSNASVVRMTAEGELSGLYGGAPPAATMQDDTGTWSIMPGAYGVLTVDPNSGRLYIISPRDVKMTDVKITPAPAPGEPFFQAASVEANLSPVAAVYERQYAAYADKLLGMTQEAAKVQIQAWQTAGEILPDVAKMLLEAFVPTLP